MAKLIMYMSAANTCFDVQYFWVNWRALLMKLMLTSAVDSILGTNRCRSMEWGGGGYATRFPLISWGFQNLKKKIGALSSSWRPIPPEILDLLDRHYNSQDTRRYTLKNKIIRNSYAFLSPKSVVLEFFLNGAELSLNSVNSENLINTEA